MMNIKNVTNSAIYILSRGGRVLYITVFALIALVGISATSQQNVSAATDTEQEKTIKDSVGKGSCLGLEVEECKSSDQDLWHYVRLGINIFSIIAGVVSVIMIIYAGFKYIISGGSSDGVKQARDTLIYAIIGLVLVLIAQVIVRFVVDEFGGDDGKPDPAGSESTPAENQSQ